MKCKQCGAEVVEGAAFCQSCGAALAATAALPPSPRERFSPAAAGGADPDDPEEALWEGRFSKLAMIGAWISAAAFSVALLIAGAFFDFSNTAWLITALVIAIVWIVLLLRLIYLQLSIKYSMTNQRLIHEHGLLWRQTDRIEAIDIDDVTVNQGPIERMLGIGTVRIVSSDQSTPQFSLVGIEDVRQVATLIDEARRKERRKRGVHIETV